MVIGLSRFFRVVILPPHKSSRTAGRIFLLESWLIDAIANTSVLSAIADAVHGTGSFKCSNLREDLPVAEAAGSLIYVRRCHLKTLWIG